MSLYNKIPLKIVPYQPKLLNSHSDTVKSPFSLINEHEMMQRQVLAKLRDMNQYKNVKYIIFPDDTLKYIWDSFIAVSLLYTMILTPYQIAFIDQDIDALNIIDYIINALFIIDILLNFFTAFESKEEILIVRHIEIFKYYATHSMLFDIISSIPYQLIIQSSSWGGVVRLGKIPRLYKIIKIIKLIRFLKVLKNFNQILKCLECLSKISVGLERLIYLILIFFTICHLFACLVFFTGNINSDSVNNWIYQNGFQDMEVEEKYLLSVYWVVTVFCTIGYGDIIPVSDTERIVIMFVELIGVFFYSYTVGTISTLMSDMRSNRSNLKKHLSTLHKIVNKHKISAFFHQKLKEALIYNDQANNSHLKIILPLLPKKIAMEFNIIVNQDLIKKNKFFERKGAEVINEILPLLKPQKIKSKEIIFKKGEFTEEIFLIKTGEVILFDYHGNSEIVVDTLHEGDYFGDVEVFLNDNHVISARANQICELLTLAKEDFFNCVLCMKTELKYEMIAKANQRKEMLIRKRNQEIMIFRKNSVGLEANYSMQYLSSYPEKEDYPNLRKTLCPSTRALLEGEVSLSEINSDMNLKFKELDKILKHLKNNRK